MKILKILGIIVLVIIVLVLGVILFGSSTAHMEREVVINAPIENVFYELNSFRTFDQYSAWSEIDTTAKVTIVGGSGIGAKYSWSSENPDLGVGSIEIIEVEENAMIKSSMNFEGYPGEPTVSWILTEEGENTKVTYTYDESDISGIWKLFALGTESMLSPMYERTLDKLKTRIESQPEFTYDIIEVQTEEQPYIGIEASSSSDPAKIGDAMGQAYGEVFGYMTKNGIEPAGAPISIVLTYDEDGTSMICGMPTASLVEIDSEKLTSGMTYEGLALKTIHKGDYALMEAAYNDVVSYASYYKFQDNGSPWEVYVTDPGTVADTAQWVTEIYYPVK